MDEDINVTTQNEKKGMTIEQMISKIISRIKLLVTALKTMNNSETKLQYQKLKKRIAIFFKRAMEENSGEKIKKKLKF